MNSRQHFEWFTALNDALVAGGGDIAEGERSLQAHYLASGWTDVAIIRPSWGSPTRDPWLPSHLRFSANPAEQEEVRVSTVETQLVRS